MAESLGLTLAGINDLTEHEFTLWMSRGPLWPRRLELLLIKLSHTVAIANHMTINGRAPRESDFDMFNKYGEELDEAANDIGVITGMPVRKLGQGRK